MPPTQPDGQTAQGEVTLAVKAILARIKEAGASGKVISFDLTGSTPYIISRAIQRMLVEKGYVAVVVFSGGRADRHSEWLYIDLSRRFGGPVVAQGQLPPGPSK